MLRMVKVGVQFVPKELNHPEVDLTCASTATRQKVARQALVIFSYGVGLMNQTTWKSLLEKARKGDASAQLDVGVYYENGFIDGRGKRIVTRDPAMGKIGDVA